MNLKSYRFHFVGIGGIGMCGLAELLHNMGAKVSGSDVAENANTNHLQSIGIKIFKGHAAIHVENAGVVVYSGAIPKTNPEIQAAQKSGIPLIPRAEALAEIMRLKRGLAIAGTHGKTTTTSLVASIFLAAKLSPTIVVGGRFEQIKSTALLGEGDWLIAEADESDGSFHKLSPEIAIITNIDSDHLDHFKTFENLENSFYDFALKVPFYGACVVCGDDLRIRKVFADFPKSIFYYGFNSDNDYILKGDSGQYQVTEKLASGESRLCGSFQLQFPGRHNALNAVAAMIASMKSGIAWDICVRGVNQFSGVDRRFQFKGEARGIQVYDDYGHHPTEVRATLQAFREKYPHQRLVVYFQPHRYSRTEFCWTEFLGSFALSDVLYITDIYPAGEAPRAGITSERLITELTHPEKIHLPKSDRNAEFISARLKAGDVFVTLGAGDGWKLGLEVLEKLS